MSAKVVERNEEVKFVDISLMDIECHCECHTNPHVMHCMPCCSQCPKCGGNIQDFWYEKHVAVCGTGKIPHA